MVWPDPHDSGRREWQPSRDQAPRAEELPVAAQKLLRLALEKVNKPAAFVSEPQRFSEAELKERPANLEEGPPDEEEGNPWDDVDVNEFEVPRSA